MLAFVSCFCLLVGYGILRLPFILLSPINAHALLLVRLTGVGTWRAILLTTFSTYTLIPTATATCQQQTASWLVLTTNRHILFTRNARLTNIPEHAVST